MDSSGGAFGKHSVVVTVCLSRTLSVGDTFTNAAWIMKCTW